MFGEDAYEANMILKLVLFSVSAPKKHPSHVTWNFTFWYGFVPDFAEYNYEGPSCFTIGTKYKDSWKKMEVTLISKLLFLQADNAAISLQRQP